MVALLLEEFPQLRGEVAAEGGVVADARLCPAHPGAGAGARAAVAGLADDGEDIGMVRGGKPPAGRDPVRGAGDLAGGEPCDDEAGADGEPYADDGEGELCDGHAALLLRLL